MINLSKILDNPKEYFDNLSNKEFDELLKEFGFDRNNMRNLTEEESEACQRALDKMSKPTGVKLFD